MVNGTHIPPKAWQKRGEFPKEGGMLYYWGKV